MLLHLPTRLSVLLLAGCVLVAQSVLSAPKKDTTPRPRTPMSVVKEAATRMNEQDLAWQFYSDYADFFHSYARQYIALKVRTKAQQALQRQWAGYFKELGDLVLEMRSIKQGKDNIRKGKTALPYVERQQHYKAAAVRHRQLLDDFVARAKSPPKQQMSLMSAEEGPGR